MLRVDGDRLGIINYAADCFENIQVQKFHPDGKRVYLTTDTGERNFAELTLLDLETGAEETVERDPEGRTDIWGALFSK